MADPEAVGRRVLLALDVGRRVAIEASQQRSAGLRRVIAQLAADDAARGRPDWGRAVRIHEQIKGFCSERWVRKILSERLSCCSELKAQDACSNEIETNE